MIWLNHLTSSQHIPLLAVPIVGAALLSTGGAPRLSLDTLRDLFLLVAGTGNAALYTPTHSILYAYHGRLMRGRLLTPYQRSNIDSL